MCILLRKLSHLHSVAKSQKDTIANNVFIDEIIVIYRIVLQTAFRAYKYVQLCTIEMHLIGLKKLVLIL